jgi:hypothetical protein
LQDYRHFAKACSSLIRKKIVPVIFVTFLANPLERITYYSASQHLPDPLSLSLTSLTCRPDLPFDPLSRSRCRCLPLRSLSGVSATPAPGPDSSSGLRFTAAAIRYRTPPTTPRNPSPIVHPRLRLRLHVDLGRPRCLSDLLDPAPRSFSAPSTASC